MSHNSIQRSHVFLLGLVTLALVWSAIKPHDYFTWFLEVAPVLIGFALIAATYHTFRLTTFLYTLIAVHSIILIIGGHYTYAEVPLFNWLRDIGVFDRNNYDKIGHFAQGFFPALYAREVFIRTSPLRGSRWLGFVCICVVALVTSLYEIIEWLVAVAVGGAGDSFLGTQGYIWDTQSDMALALVGSIIALVLLSEVHDRALKKL